MNWQEMAEELGLIPDLTGRLEQLVTLERQVGRVSNGPEGKGMATSRRPQSPERVR